MEVEVVINVRDEKDMPEEQRRALQNVKRILAEAMRDEDLD